VISTFAGISCFWHFSTTLGTYEKANKYLDRFLMTSSFSTDESQQEEAGNLPPKRRVVQATVLCCFIRWQNCAFFITELFTMPLTPHAVMRELLSVLSLKSEFNFLVIMVYWTTHRNVVHAKLNSQLNSYYCIVERGIQSVRIISLSQILVDLFDQVILRWVVDYTKELEFYRRLRSSRFTSVVLCLYSFSHTALPQLVSSFIV